MLRSRSRGYVWMGTGRHLSRYSHLLFIISNHCIVIATDTKCTWVVVLGSRGKVKVSEELPRYSVSESEIGFRLWRHQQEDNIKVLLTSEPNCHRRPTFFT